MVSLAKPVRYLGDVQDARNSHKKAQKDTKTETRAHAGTAFWTAGFLPRIDSDCFRLRALKDPPTDSESSSDQEGKCRRVLQGAHDNCSVWKIVRRKPTKGDLYGLGNSKPVEDQ